MAYTMYLRFVLSLICVWPVYQLLLRLRRASSKDFTEDRLVTIFQPEQIQPDKAFDIIAVHGLGAHPKYTWYARDGAKRVSWLKSFLPLDFEHARIMTFRHDADYVLNLPRESPYSSGEELLRAIQERQNVARRPVIIIAHSYGGNVVKAAITKASRTKEFASVASAIAGLIFLGTPHHGSGMAAPASSVLEWLGLLLGSDTLLLKFLSSRESLKEAHEAFTDACGHLANNTQCDLWRTSHCFYENRDSYIINRVPISIGKVVEEISAGGSKQEGPQPLDKTHAGMNKFASREDKDYKRVRNAIDTLQKGCAANRCRSEQDRRAIAEVADLIYVRSCDSLPQYTRPNLSHKFLNSNDYLDWCSADAPEQPRHKQPRHNIWLRLSRTNADKFPLAQVTDGLRSANHDACYMAFGPVESMESKTHRASTMLRTSIATMIVGNVGRLEAFATPARRRDLLDTMSSERSLEQRRYWSILSDLVNQISTNRIYFIIDRLDRLDETDIPEFVVQLMALRDRCIAHGHLRILASGLPKKVIEDHLGHDFHCFSPERDFYDAMQALRGLTENPRAGGIKPPLGETGSWILPDFDAFMAKPESDIFCIKGPSGSGKSTLIKYLAGHTQRKFGAPTPLDMSTLDLLRIARDEPEEISANKEKVIVASYFYYFDVQSKAQMSHRSMLLSIIYQMLFQEPQLFGIWTRIVPRVDDIADLDLERLRTIFMGMTTSCRSSIKVVLFLDAIDESMNHMPAPGHDMEIQRYDMLNLLGELCQPPRSSDPKDDSANTSPHNFLWKIVLASRELDKTVPHMKGRTLRIIERNSKDITTIVTDRMNAIREVLRLRPIARIQEGQLLAFESDLRERACGVILWIKLILDLVLLEASSHTLTPAYLHECLAFRTDDLDELYERSVLQLKQVRNLNIEKSRMWLLWGTMTWYSLRVIEFADAVALVDMPRDLVTINRSLSSLDVNGFRDRIPDLGDEQGVRTALACVTGSFLELKAPNLTAATSLKGQISLLKQHEYIIEPVHETARAFLASRRASEFQLEGTAGEATLATACITYLKLALTSLLEHTSTKPSLAATAEALDHYALLGYVLGHLAHHLDRMPEDQDILPFFDRLRALNDGIMPQQSTTFVSTLIVWATKCSKQSKQPRLSANWNECAEYWLDLAKRSYQAAVMNNNDFLETAAKHRYLNTIDAVLASGALSNGDNEAIRIRLVLEVQAGEAEGGKVRQILQRHQLASTASSSSDDQRITFGLMRAIECGLGESTIASLLLQTSELNSRDEGGLSPLHMAAKMGQSQIVKMLIEAGADVNTTDASGNTPVVDAAMRGHEIVVGQLLAAGAVVHQAGRAAPLLQTVRSLGHEAVAQLLVAYGSSIMSSGNAAFRGPLTDTQPPRWYTVPVKQTECFVPRPYLVAAIEEEFANTASAFKVVAVSGLGGIGKTQLAVTFAQSWYESHEHGSVFWIDGDTQNSIQRSCRYLLEVIHPPAYHQDSSPADAPHLFSDWLASRSNKDWLLVIDNLDEVELARSALEPLSRASGCVLVTTRSRLVADILRARTIKLELTTEEQGRAMLESHLGHVEDDQPWLELIHVLNNLPLAIVQAASFIRRQDLSIRQYLQLFHRDSRNVNSLISQEFEQSRGPRGLPNALSTTWAITFRSISATRSSAADLLALISVLDPDNCPSRLLAASQFSSTIDHDVSVLASYQLVQRDNQGTLRTHRLIQSATRQWLTGKGSLERWQMSALQLVASEFPTRRLQAESGIADKHYCLHLQAHAMVVLRYDVHTVEEHGHRVQLLRSIAAYLEEQSQFHDAENMLRSALRDIDEMGSEKALSCCAKAELAMVLARQSELVQAEELIKKCLDTQQNLLPRLPRRHKEDYISSLVTLAVILRLKASLPEAARTIEAALAYEERPPTDTEVLSTQLTYSAILLDMGRYDEAIECLKKLMPESVPERLRLAAQNNLAAAYVQMSKIEEAEKLLTDVLAIRLATHELQNSSSWGASINLGSSLRSQARWEEAERIERSTLDSARAVLPPEHPMVLIIMANLAQTLRDKSVEFVDKCHSRIRDPQALKEAADMAHRIVMTRNVALGHDHPESLAARELEASIICHDGRFTEAEAIMKAVINTRLRLKGPENAEYLTSVASYAAMMALNNANDLEVVAKLEEQVLQGRKPLLGDDHPSTIAIFKSLSETQHTIWALTAADVVGKLEPAPWLPNERDSDDGHDLKDSHDMISESKPGRHEYTYHHISAGDHSRQHNGNVYGNGHYFQDRL